MFVFACSTTEMILLSNDLRGDRPPPQKPSAKLCGRRSWGRSLYFREWESVPKKIRELKQLLRKAGFQELPGKGSHTNWIHPLYAGKITVSGQDSFDAKPYQEKAILSAIQDVEKPKDG